MRLLQDSNLWRDPQREALAHARAASGLSSSTWVACPRCAVGRGDPCRSGSTCPERHEANAARLLRLPTWGVAFQTPCCDRLVWLVWRTAADDLTWSGVPCFECGATFGAQFYASDIVPKRVPVQRVHPDRVEVVCWASEDSPDDTGTTAGPSGS